MTAGSLPFDRIGGRAPIARLVERFYALMDGDPAYAALRAMHAPDLRPMRESLTSFLVAWTGGPRDWFEKRPGACIMSAHGEMRGMTCETARQWLSAMARAMAETGLGEPELEAIILAAMERMCTTMARRAEAEATLAG